MLQALAHLDQLIDLYAFPFSDEFSPGNALSDDDEETIAKEEEENAADTRAEIAALQKESEMDLDDLDFLSDYLKNRDKIVLSDGSDDDDDAEPTKSSSSSRKRVIADEESNVSALALNDSFHSSNMMLTLYLPLNLRISILYLN